MHKRRIEVVEISGLETCLSLWEDMRRRGGISQAMGSMKLLSGEGDGYGDSETQDAREDSRIADAVDTEIMDLPRTQWWCVWKARGIATCWRYPNINYEETLSVALTTLEARLRKNPDTWNLF